MQLLLIQTPSNYEIIYKRIANDVTVPVYYADGRIASLSNKDTRYEQNKYWESSYKELKNKIDKADIVSFDIFDTLIMRKVFSPEDVVQTVRRKGKSGIKIRL